LPVGLLACEKFLITGLFGLEALFFFVGPGLFRLLALHLFPGPGILGLAALDDCVGASFFGLRPQPKGRASTQARHQHEQKKAPGGGLGRMTADPGHGSLEAADGASADRLAKLIAAQVLGQVQGRGVAPNPRVSRP